MARSSKTGGNGAGVVRGAGGEGSFVRGFVKSPSSREGLAVALSVEALGREQQRRAVAYGRSRGQL